MQKTHSIFMILNKIVKKSSKLKRLREGFLVRSGYRVLNTV